MGDLINLRTARKRKLRAEKERQAAENRVLHGRSRADATIARSMLDTTAARHEGHRRDPRPDGEDGTGGDA